MSVYSLYEPEVIKRLGKTFSWSDGAIGGLYMLVSVTIQFAAFVLKDSIPFTVAMAFTFAAGLLDFIGAFKERVLMYYDSGILSIPSYSREEVVERATIGVGCFFPIIAGLIYFVVFSIV